MMRDVRPHQSRGQRWVMATATIMSVAIILVCTGIIAAFGYWLIRYLLA